MQACVKDEHHKFISQCQGDLPHSLVVREDLEDQLCQVDPERNTSVIIGWMLQYSLISLVFIDQNLQGLQHVLSLLSVQSLLLDPGIKMVDVFHLKSHYSTFTRRCRITSLILPLVQAVP